jgi:hypothetical protein
MYLRIRRIDRIVNLKAKANPELPPEQDAYGESGLTFLPLYCFALCLSQSFWQITIISSAISPRRQRA